MLTSHYKTFNDGTLWFFYDNGAHYEIASDRLDEPDWVPHLVGKGLNERIVKSALTRAKRARWILYRDRLISSRYRPQSMPPEIVTAVAHYADAYLRTEMREGSISFPNYLKKENPRLYEKYISYCSTQKSMSK